MTESILQEPNPAQQLLFIALDPTNELVSIADANGRIHYLNKAGEQLFGRKPGERRGFSLQELIGGSDDQMGQIRRELAERGFWRGSVRARTNEGGSGELTLRMSLVPNDPSMAVMLGAEASEMHEIETKLLRAQRLELVGEISAGLVHDLNNVLLPITLAAEMYAPDKPEEELRRLYAAS